MKLLLLYWGIMILCYIAAYKLRSRRDSFGFMGGALNAVIYILVFIIGLRMGANEEVTSSLGTIGVQAVLITVFTVCGSMAAVTVLRKILGLNRQGAADNMPEAKLEAQLTEAEYAETQLENELESQLEKETAENKEEKGGAAKTTVLILVCVAAGMALGYLLIPRLFADIAVFQEMSGNWLVAGICVLLGLVGHNGDFLSLAVLYDLSGNRYIRKIRCADFKLFSVAVGEDFVNCDGLVGFSGKLFNEDFVILGDLVLFAAGLDNCVHSFIHPFL